MANRLGSRAWTVGATTCALVVAASTTARAQPGTQPTTAPAAAPDAVDPGTATTISVVSTLGSLALVAVGGRADSAAADTALAVGAAGLLVGPTGGHWYAGRAVTPWLGVRVGGAAVVAAGAFLVVHCDDSSACDNKDLETNVGIAGVVVGSALFLTGLVGDIATAGDTARARNTARLMVTPTAMTGAAGHAATGLALTGAF